MYPTAYHARDGFTDQDVWRAALGDAEPLRPFASTDGPIDAPEWLPAGAMRANPYGPQALAVNRNPWGD